MFNFLKKNKNNESTAERKSWIERLGAGLKKTKDNFTDGLENLIKGKKVIDDALLEEIETQLLLADIGVSTTEKIIEELTEKTERKQLNDPEALMETLKMMLIDLLEPVSHPLQPKDESPFVLLVIGVNGAGKTTSIAKIAHYFQQQGKKVMLAAGDTFRAAAIEQLQVWGERKQIPVVAQQPGADSAAVIYDALLSAKAKKMDILIADTAGRLHTQSNLMNELAKIKRVIKKIDNNAPHETMLVLDASMGQNALAQAEQFNKDIEINSLSITKLDGTAKGGIVFSIADKLQLPYRFIGVGESIEDLEPFRAKEFVSALFN